MAPATTTAEKDDTVRDFKGRTIQVRDGLANPVTMRLKFVRILVQGPITNLWLVETVVGRRLVAKIFPRPTSLLKVAEFYREAEIGAKHRHPGLMETEAFGTIEGCPTLLMPFYSGKDFHVFTQDTLAASSRSDRARIVVDCMLQLLEALRYLHKHDIAYRDVKPENIYVVEGEGESPRIKLLDFGISKPQGSNLTAPGLDGGKGSPYYMAPEQLVSMGSSAMFPCDVWGACITFLEALEIAHPFGLDAASDWREQVAKLMELYRTEEDEAFLLGIPSDWQMSDEQSRFLYDTVAGCLRLDPRTRYSAQGFYEALLCFQRMLPVPDAAPLVASSAPVSAPDSHVRRVDASSARSITLPSFSVVADGAVAAKSSTVSVTVLSTPSQTKPPSKALTIVAIVLAVAAFVSTWIRVLDLLRSL